MSTTYKPNHYNSVSPYLIVNSAEATLTFLKNVFWRYGAAPLPKRRRENHARRGPPGRYGGDAGRRR